MQNHILRDGIGIQATGANLAAHGEVLQQVESPHHPVRRLVLAKPERLEGLGVRILHALPGFHGAACVQQLPDEVVADAGGNLAHVERGLLGRHYDGRRLAVPCNHAHWAVRCSRCVTTVGGRLCGVGGKEVQR